MVDRLIVDVPDCDAAVRPIDELPSRGAELSPAETGGRNVQPSGGEPLTRI